MGRFRVGPVGFVRKTWNRNRNLENQFRSGSGTGCSGPVQILGTKKMMNSNRICPAVGSQYIDSAVGLVFMESAVGLATETSRVKSAVRNQARAKLNQLKYNESAGTMTTSCKR
ncbi:hypothetical protein F511_08983 [Dorcoceras hygrometricum]|uniref:Uncharacterized protein n=1 Tax=Dorcoceras hygrometricum TaxID=472368 RepID=A0A2Z7AXR0_9LAMI|nr:hypothetical protein F511_08983 [Dorcoceras hygrometricum]